jgi:AcrR family transcriptional regulator
MVRAIVIEQRRQRPSAGKGGGTAAPSRVTRRRSDGEQTWRRVLDAAVACILEQGYYRASSNEIARRAGVTWGVIQHQFGTREGLLLAVLNDRWATMEHRMETAEVSGDTLEERLTCVLDVLASHYGKPEHLVQLQILLDLTHNPTTSEDTRRAVADHGAALTRGWQPLFDSALGEAAKDPVIVRYAFSTLRGYLTGQLVASHIADTSDDTVPRRLLVEGVAAAIRSETARRAS